MPKKRRLTDLYVVGKEVTFDDGQGEAITVYIRKLSPVDYETALRRANGARSRAAAIKNDPTSDEFLSLHAVVDLYSRDDLVLYLVEDHRQERAPVIEAELAAADEWSKENYLQGLHDSWNDGLALRWAADQDDGEAKRVRSELDRFESQVSSAVQAELDDLQAELEDRPDEALRSSVLDKILAVRASIAWLNEYRRCEVWLSVRELDHRTKYFQDRSEVDELPAKIYDALTETYISITVDPTEGKDSAATLPSSHSSAPPEEPVTVESSGPTGAAA